jgi:hypothetical protein
MVNSGYDIVKKMFFYGGVEWFYHKYGDASK